MKVDQTHLQNFSGLIKPSLLSSLLVNLLDSVHMITASEQVCGPIQASPKLFSLLIHLAS